jgi:AbrB family looped-hinge helix DNA binding protein
MTTLTITSKGQITLKKEVLRHLGVGPGDMVEVELLPKGQVKVGPVPARGSIQDFVGMFKDKVTRPVSIEEMNQVIADGWAGRL